MDTMPVNAALSQALQSLERAENILGNHLNNVRPAGPEASAGLAGQLVKGPSTTTEMSNALCARLEVLANTIANLADRF